jgi:hypothetical protein
MWIIDGEIGYRYRSSVFNSRTAPECSTSAVFPAVLIWCFPVFTFSPALATIRLENEVPAIATSEATPPTLRLKRKSWVSSLSRFVLLVLIGAAFLTQASIFQCKRSSRHFSSVLMYSICSRPFLLLSLARQTGFSYLSCSSPAPYPNFEIYRVSYSFSTVHFFHALSSILSSQ